MKIALRVSSCTECPNRRYYSGWRYNCAAVNAPLPEDMSFPDWCPLPNDPAQLAARSAEMLAAARRVLAVATQEAANTETSPARLRDLLDMAANQLTRYA